MLSIKKKNCLVSFDLITEAGRPINSRTDINVISEAASSCLSYDPLLEGGKQMGEKQRNMGNRTVH